MVNIMKCNGKTWTVSDGAKSIVQINGECWVDGVKREPDSGFLKTVIKWIIKMMKKPNG